MKNIKKSILIFVLISVGLISTRQVIAETAYTQLEVAQHNTKSNCWATYNDGVYDITTYLNIHNQKYSDITTWCGTDMTTDFDATPKHRGEAATLLASFKVGTLIVAETQTSLSDTITPPIDTPTGNSNSSAISTEVTPKSISSVNPYNLIIPLLLGIVLYWGSLMIFKKQLKQFNAFWNTILFLTFVIPSFGFGIVMMLQYKLPTLMDINFRFMYWHVEFSVFMGVLAISHFIRRLKIYLVQIKRK